MQSAKTNTEYGLRLFVFIWANLSVKIKGWLVHSLGYDV